MGKSDQPSRSKLMAWLAAFVVVFGTVSWLITMDVGFHGVPPTRPPNRPIGSPTNTVGLHVQPVGGGWNLQRMCHADFR